MTSAARMGEKRGTERIWWENLEEWDHVENLDVEGRLVVQEVWWQAVDLVDLTKHEVRLLRVSRVA